jgi:hypothetical protein
MLTNTLSTWADAHTLTDLGELTARWLEGNLPAGHPNYGLPGEAVGPDPETEPLVPTLAAANRAKFVTITSQPGEPDETGYDGAWWQMRAAVEGFTDLATLTRLDQAVQGHPDLLLIGHRSWSKRPSSGVPVTLRAGLAYTSFGWRMTKRYLRFAYSGCHRDALAALYGAWQVTLIDLVWSRDTKLWPLLTDALTDAALTNGREVSEP